MKADTDAGSVVAIATRALVRVDADVDAQAKKLAELTAMPDKSENVKKALELLAHNAKAAVAVQQGLRRLERCAAVLPPLVRVELSDNEAQLLSFAYTKKIDEPA